MKKPKVLYFIRSEADLERIVSISIPGKKYALQYFAYYGDINILFEHGIKNKFQKYMLSSNGFKVIDIVTLSFVGKLYKVIKSIEINNRTIRFILKVCSRTLEKVIFTIQRKDKLAQKLLKQLMPSILITDNSVERANYFPHCLRQEALKSNIKIHVTGHGPAGGLHKEYHSYDKVVPDACLDMVVGICSKHDYGYGMPNRIITGDPADGYPHLLLKHEETYDDIFYYNERKYKIGFFMSAPFETCTNSWSIMEEIMFDFSFREDTAMIAKFHPRLYKLGDYRYLKKINNLKLYGPELDRSRLVKWADIVVCSDHCSMLFEGMILHKKVVAIHSKKVRPFANFKSKIHDCDPSMNSIYNASEMKLDKLTNYTSDTAFINEYCWGDLGKIDLGEKIIKEMILND
jgi:hypothetical protein